MATLVDHLNEVGHFCCKRCNQMFQTMDELRTHTVQNHQPHNSKYVNKKFDPPESKSEPSFTQVENLEKRIDSMQATISLLFEELQNRNSELKSKEKLL